MELRWRAFSCRPLLPVGTSVLGVAEQNPTSPYEITGISTWPLDPRHLWSQPEA